MKKIYYIYLNFFFIIFFSVFFTFIFKSSTAYTDGTNLRGEVYFGNASWYGWKFHGRITSNGEKFNKNEYTAANNFLPFNSLVKVTNLKNNKIVIVRINDRGPFKDGRIIDLSEKAAKEIDAKNAGIVYVKLQVIKKGSA